MRVKPTTASHGVGLRGTKHYSGTEGEVLEASLRVMKSELRVWLLQSLMDRNLATRDVFNFAEQQANLRYCNKTPDLKTMRQAMIMKLGDSKLKLKAERRHGTDKLFSLNLITGNSHLERK